MRHFHSTAMVSIAALCSAWPAYAQSADTDGAAEAAQGQSNVIIVTAQRREQDLQSVPASVSVLTGSEALSQGITSTQDLAVNVPGLSFTQLFTGASFYLRGVGRNDTNTGQEMPVAVYVDGVYLATPTGSLFSFNNIERVEVLRGPQGTLFGRNATGGVIQVVTREPSHRPEVMASIGYGNYDTVTGNLYATTGITDTLAADIAVYYNDQNDGWGTNVFTGDEVFTSRELNVRSRWQWEPTETTTVSLTADYTDAASDQGSNLIVYPGSVGFLETTNPGFYNYQSEIPTSTSSFDQWGVALNIQQEMDWANLVSISGYRELREEVIYDGDVTPFFGLIATRQYPADTFTQELQLVSPSGSSIQWIVGLYYLRQRAALEPLELSGLALGAGPDFVLSRTAVQHTTSYAAFGEITVPLGDSTNITAGARYTYDRRRLEAQDVSDFGTGPLIEQTAHWSEPTYRVVLDHEFSSQVMAYAQYSRGFKSGQFNVVQPADPAVDPETLDAFEIGLKTETSDGRLRVNIAGYYYRYANLQLQRAVVGGNQFFNAGRARMRGIDIDFDWRVSDIFSIRGGLAYLDAIFTSFPDAPSYVPQVGGGNASVDIDASGNRLPNAPEWQLSIGPRATFPTSFGDLTFSAQYAFSSGFYFTPANRLSQPAYHMMNASVEWNSPDERWGLRLWGKNLFDEEIVGYNSEQAFGDLYSPVAPMTYGITASFRFGG